MLGLGFEKTGMHFRFDLSASRLRFFHFVQNDRAGLRMTQLGFE
jgi:hypothetical protein